MKIINQLVVQSDMPNDNNVIWVCGNTAKYYNNGTWTTLGESNEDRKELEEKVDSLDKEMGEVKKRPIYIWFRTRCSRIRNRR